MKIVVTGANGFIGSNITRYLCKQGHEIYGVYHKNDSNRPAGVNGIFCDLSKGLEADVDADAIIHTAAKWYDTASDYMDYVNGNIIATKSILEFAYRQNVKKIIYIGAVSSYGTVFDSLLKPDSPHIEPSDYGLTKLVAERMVRECGISNRIVILPGVIGKGCHNNWLFNTASALYEGRDITVYNPDGVFNNIVDVKSVCAFINLLLEDEGVVSDTYILGMREKIQIRQLVKLLADEYHSASVVTWDDSRSGFYIDISNALHAGFIAPTLEDIQRELITEVKRRR